MKKLLLLAFLALACAPALAAGQPTPLTMGIDRTQDPSPVCVYRTTSGTCRTIGTIGSDGSWHALLGAPSPSVPGGIVSTTCTAHQFANAVGTGANGASFCAQPTVSDVTNAFAKTGDTMTGHSFVGPQSVPSIVDLFTSPPANMIGMGAGGARLSFSGLPGHLPGDSERTQFYVKSTAQTGPAIEETAADIEMNNATGYTQAWLAGATFPASTYVHSGANIYQSQSTGSCTAGTTGPSGSGSNITDGTCTWSYVGNSNGDGKSALLLTNLVGPNGGAAWGAAIDVPISTGAWSGTGGSAIGVEIDTPNYAKDCPPGVNAGCSVTGLFIDNTATYKGTVGIQGGGGTGYHIGVNLGQGFASDIGLSEATGAAIGIETGGPHSNSALYDSSTTPVGLNFAGTYSQYQIQGVGWRITGGATPGVVVSDNGMTTPFLNAPGTNSLILGTASHGKSLALLDVGATGANYFTMQGTPTGFGPTLKADGSDANVDLNMQAKGAGVIRLSSAANVSALSVGGALNVAGATTFQAAAVGTTFKLTPTTVAALPTCNAGAQGTQAAVSDLSAAPTYRQTGLTGGGSVYGHVECNGAAWEAH